MDPFDITKFDLFDVDFGFVYFTNAAVPGFLNRSDTLLQPTPARPAAFGIFAPR